MSALKRYHWHDQALRRLIRFPFMLIIFAAIVAGIGVTALYSAAGGSFEPWANRHAARFGMMVLVAIGLAMINVGQWRKLAYPIYGAWLMALLAVDVAGKIGMGAQRWLKIGPLQLQPSEFMKIALILALARFLHGRVGEDIGRWRNLLMACVIIGAPMALVMVQPDLGTAMTLGIVGTIMLFLAGVPLWIFGAGAAAIGAMLPIAWSVMYDYQRKRVLTFLDPESDPLGAGYHITQSKIALGSGGLFGKGYLNGSQSYLNFLPEKQTDFIFTLWAEEWGMLGCLCLLTAFALLIGYGVYLGFRCRTPFCRLLAFGLSTNLFVYVAINCSMVMGLMPVVGVPLPMVSYGGTAMLSIMTGIGILAAVSIDRDQILSRRGIASDRD